MRKAAIVALIVILILAWLATSKESTKNVVEARIASATPTLATPQPDTMSPREREVAAGVFGIETHGASTAPTPIEDIETTASVAATLGFYEAFDGFFAIGTEEEMGSQGIATQIIEPLILGLLQEIGLSDPKLLPLTVFSFAWKCKRTVDDEGAGCVQAVRDLGESVAEMAACELVVEGRAKELRGYVSRLAENVRGKLPTSRLLDATKHPEIAKVVNEHRKARDLMKHAADTLERTAKSGLDDVAQKLARTKIQRKMGTVTRLWTKLTSVTAKKIATRASVSIATDVGVKVATEVATKQLAKTATRLAKAANVAVLLLEVAVDVTLMLLDKFCVGNFDPKCHLAAEHVKQLSEYFIAQFHQHVPREESRASIMYTKRISESKKNDIESDVRGAVIENMVQNPNNFFLMTGFPTPRAWVAMLKGMPFAEQLESLMNVKLVLTKESNDAIALGTAKLACNSEPGASWIETERVCSVTPTTCCSRVAATDAMYAYASASSDAAKAAASAAKLVLYALLDDVRVLVDIFEAAIELLQPRERVLTPHDFEVLRNDTRFASWLKSEAERDDDDKLVGLEHTVRLATVRVLARVDYVQSKAETIALLRACHKALASRSANEARERALDEEGMSDTWPSLGREDTDEFANIRFLRSYPALLALSYRWHPYNRTSQGYNAGCGLGDGNVGHCVPDTAAMLHAHVCPFLKARQQQPGMPGAADDVSAPDGDVRDFSKNNKLGHIVDWNAKTCAVSTDYCERYEYYPTLNGSADEGCKYDESAKRKGLESLSFYCLTSCVSGLGGVACAACIASAATQNLPSKQCESVRNICQNGDSRCRCEMPPYTMALTSNVVMETGNTGALGLLATIRGALGANYER